MRESPVRGPAVDLSEFERRMRGPEPRRGGKADPLSELARLMGETGEADPYGDILPDPRAAQAEAEPAAPPAPPAPAWEEDLRGAYREEAPQPAQDPRYAEHDPRAAAEADYAPQDYQRYYDQHGAPAQHPGHAGQGYEEQVHPGQARADQGYADQGYADQGYPDQGYADQDGYAEQEYAEHVQPGHVQAGHVDAGHVQPEHVDAGRGRAGQAYGGQGYAGQGHPDERYDAAYGEAEGNWSDDAPYLDYGAEDEEAEVEEGGARRRLLRPWHAVAAISILAAGSIAWGFLHRNGSPDSREIATIDAPEGPVKVKPTAATERDGPDASGAAVLDRKEPPAVRQVVTNQEQAVDPNVVPKTVKLGSGPVDAPHEPALGTQPRKVKTVTVRPDGSRVDDVPLPLAVAKATNPPEDPAATRGGTPKAETTPATTPRAAKPKAPPKVAAVAPPEPEADADAAPPSVSGGAYAVQFGAAATEAEARGLMKTVSGKYGALLGGARPSFKSARVGDRTVYRVRVGGMGKDAAVGICTKVKASGGSCFVAKN